MDETTTFSTTDYDYSSFISDSNDSLYTSILLPILYSVVFLTGVVGNLILMGSLCFKKGSSRRIDIFIVNLAASDFVFLVTLPLWVDKEASSGLWRTGSFLCKSSSYIISVNMYSSVFFLTCMSADRFLSIVCPSSSRRIRSRSFAAGACISVWLSSCILGLPTALHRTLTFTEGKPFCIDIGATPTKRAYALVSLIFTFFVPLLSILACYLSIMRKLCVHYQHSRKHNKKLRNSIQIIFFVVMAFVFSWAPFNTFKLLSIISGLQEDSFFSSRTLQLGMEFSSPLAFAHSCINPFIYYGFDSYIRRAIGQRLCSCLRSQDYGSSTETSESHLSKINFNYVEDSIRKRKNSVLL